MPPAYPVTSIFTVETPAGPIEVEVVRKRVKNLNLRILRDGSVHASVPARIPDQEIRAFLARRAGWIAAHRARRRDAPAAPSGRLTSDGRVALWGALIPLVDACAQEGVALGARTFGGHLDRTAPAPDDVERAVQDLYRRACARAVQELAPQVEDAVGVHATSWQLRRMKSRWGSCTPARGTIRISTELAGYPQACLASVMAHELVHLLEPSHNARFHALLDERWPQARSCRPLLKQPALTLALSDERARSRPPRL